MLPCASDLQVHIPSGPARAPHADRDTAGAHRCLFAPSLWHASTTIQYGRRIIALQLHPAEPLLLSRCCATKMPPIFQICCAGSGVTFCTISHSPQGLDGLYGSLLSSVEAAAAGFEAAATSTCLHVPPELFMAQVRCLLPARALCTICAVCSYSAGKVTASLACTCRQSCSWRRCAAARWHVLACEYVHIVPVSPAFPCRHSYSCRRMQWQLAGKCTVCGFFLCATIGNAPRLMHMRSHSNSFRWLSE